MRRSVGFNLLIIKRITNQIERPNSGKFRGQYTNSGDSIPNYFKLQIGNFKFAIIFIKYFGIHLGYCLKGDSMMIFTGGRLDPEQLKKAKEHPGYRRNDKSNPQHRQLIGYIGLFLPLLLILMAVLRDGVAQWRDLKSVSAYYYTGGVAAFVGMLVALSLFLFTYRGYKNKYYCADRVISVIAAAAALGVAVFPTVAPEGVIHYPGGPRSQGFCI